MVCAYKENPYLEECVKSVVNQSVKSNVVISTSTPNNYIKNIAKKYNLKMVINYGIDKTADNFNFAFSQAETDLVTLCHQDDCYDTNYVKYLLLYINKAKKPLMFFSDYNEIRGNNIIKSNKLLKVKRILLHPLKSPMFWPNKFIRRRILSFGDPICCPSVAFSKKNVSNPIFDSKYKGTLDWRAWEIISRSKGDFVYCSIPLIYHRIHENSETTEMIVTNIRTTEELEVFELFWPKWIAKKLNKLYLTSQKSNTI
jgi:Glycosyl transferase family 2.